MANIQEAMPAKFLQIAGDNKLKAKEGLADKAGTAASPQANSFQGVLKSQMSKPDALPEGMLGIRSNMPTELVSGFSSASASFSASDTTPEPTTEAQLLGAVEEVTKGQLPDSDEDADALQTVAPGPMTTAAAGVVTVSASSVLPKTDAALPQEAESDASASQASGNVGASAEVGIKPEVANKTGEAAIAAVAGQTLPQGKADKAGEASAYLNSPGLQSKREDAASNDVATPFGTRADASTTSASSSLNGSNASSASPAATLAATVTSSNNPIALANPFDQALRQAETKINAAIETSVRSPAFAAELGGKVVWLASRQGQFAELSLNPAQMGALEVRLNLSGSGDASAQFFSPNPIVRDAIDAALPRLREMMAQAGINLGEAEVREHAFGRGEQSEPRGQRSAQEAETPLHASVMAGVGGTRSAGIGLVDLYI